MRRRCYMRKDYMAYLGEEDSNWAVYDRQSKDPDERPLAVFARRKDAVRWAKSENQA